jgi:tryptophan synthase alpha chain
MSRIAETFAKLKQRGRAGFIPFIMAGDPHLSITEKLLIELAEAGADIIELGVPFSDPVADGEVIQRASERALRNGVTLGDVLALGERVRARISTPVVLFSYFNPLLQFGEERFATAVRRAGIDGVLVTDLIPEEAQAWSERLRAHDVDPIYLVAPTTTDSRLESIAEQARGFIYAIARTGVTGARDAVPATAKSLVQRIRAVCNLPVAVGFGVSSGEQVQQVCQFADAAVIGSAIVREIEKLNGSGDLVLRIRAFARSLVASAAALRREGPPAPGDSANARVKKDAW